MKNILAATVIAKILRTCGFVLFPLITPIIVNTTRIRLEKIDMARSVDKESIENNNESNNIITSEL